MSARNYIFDSIKFFCAFLVILIHTDYPYKQYMHSITDIAVPMFFCISGFFIYGKPNKMSRINRILYIMTWSFALYYIKTTIFQLSSTGSFFVPTFGDLTNFVLFNHVVFALHLWYLAAYVYVLAIAWVINRHDKWNWIFLSIIPIVVLGSLVKLYIGESNYTHDYYKWNNFMFLGVPYFFAGAFFKRYKEKFQYLAKKKIALVIMILVLIIARYIVASNYSWAIIADIDRFILVSLLFVFFMGCTQRKENIWSLLGNNYSLFIYIFHVLVYQVIELVAKKLLEPYYTIYMYFNPLCVLLTTMLVVYIIRAARLNKYLE